MACVILGTGDTAVSKTCALVEFALWWEKTDSNQVDIQYGAECYREI